MKTKAKKFSKKLLALFLAVLMAVSCFAGTITSYGAIAKSKDMTYHDADVMYNELGWTVLSDEQAATALLDMLDEVLAGVGKMMPQIRGKINSMKLPSPVKMSLDQNNRFKLSAVVNVIDITLDLSSVDGILKTIYAVQTEKDSGVLKAAINVADFGIIEDINFNAANGVSRSTHTSCEIFKTIFKLLYDNQVIFNKILQGTASLGALNGVFDIYGTIGGLVNAPSGFQSNLIYNVVQQLIFNYTNWYTRDEVIAFRGGRPAGTTDADGKELPAIEAKTFVFDDQLLDKMTTELLDKISVLVTYNQEYNVLDPDTLKPVKDENGKYIVKQDTSATRYLEIKALMDAGKTYQQAATQLGYDPNLVYSDEFQDEEGNYLNVLLFAYGNADPKTGLATETTEKIILGKNDSLFGFGQQALRFAWKTVLKGTLGLLHVNNDYDFGHGANFDNNYYYYIDQAYGWDKKNIASNYTEAKVQEWANHLVHSSQKGADGTTTDVKVPLYESYGAANAAEFLGWVKDQLTNYDRTLKKGSTGKWSDIDATTLVAKVRYSPLADYYFNEVTGPVNLYFMQTGSPKLDAFFDNYYVDGKFTYTSMVAAFNDLLVAAVDDIFVNRANVSNVANLPTLTKVGSGYTSITSAEVSEISNTLVGNALEVIQYTADAIDANILKAFYDANGKDAKLTEANIETAMVPLLIACIGQINLDGKLCELIHPRDWDSCKDAEGIVFLALEEYLSYVLPDYDYRQLITRDAEGKFEASLETTILPMARDAVTYVMEGYVPVYDGDGNMFKVENKKPGDAGYYVNGYASGTYNKAGANDLFTLLNSVVCYYADRKTVTANGNEKGLTNGVANLLGLVEQDGTSKINTNNDLFTNINIIANKVLPVIGTLQGKGYGSADSYDLIWNKIVKGILDIGPNSGVTNFLNQLLTIVSATPIQANAITLTVYDVLKDLLNALFGPRYNNQSWVPVPDRTSDHPFDDVLQRDVIAGTYTTNDKGEVTSTSPGMLVKAILNLIEFTGVQSNLTTYPDTILAGAMFALTSVNSLVHFIPRLDAASINQASASYDKGEVKSNVSASSTITDVLTIENNCSGINTVVVNKDGSLTQNSRYAMKIKSVNGSVAGTANGATITLDQSLKGKVLAPDERVETTVSFKAASTGNAVYIAEIVYDVVEFSNTNNVVVANQKVTAYKCITPDVSWVDSIYPAINGVGNTEAEISASYARGADGVNYYPESVEKVKYGSDGKTTTTNINGFEFADAAGIGKFNDVVVRYPKEFVIDKSNPNLASSYGILAHNKAGASQRDLNGVFTYQPGRTVVNDLAADPTATYTTGIYDGLVEFDRTTGDILKMDKLDYSTDQGKTWVRKDANHTNGFYYNEIQDKLGNNNFITRPHVVFTLEEAKTANILRAAHKNPDTKLYEYVFVNPYEIKGSKYNYATLSTMVSWSSGVEGLYIESPGTTTFGAGKNIYFKLFNYDGHTDLKAGKAEYPIYLHAWNSNSNRDKGLCQIELYIADDSSKAGLKSAFDALADAKDYYAAEDFVSQTYYGATTDQLVSALKTYSVQSKPSVITSTDSTTMIGDNKVLTANTTQTTSKLGDLAYKPFTTSNDGNLPKEVKADATVKNGVYYFDKAGTMPIYTNSPLTDADVSGGKDAAGIAVEKNKKGEYHVVNEAAYKTQWQAQEPGLVHKYPIRIQSTVLLKDDNNRQIYNQIQYEYRNADNYKVNSDMEWVCKFPSTYYGIVPSTRTTLATTENRGIFSQHKDNLEYYNEQLGETRDTSAAETLFAGVTEKRTGLVQNNFDTVSFYRMQNTARDIERNYVVYIYHEAEDEYGEIQEIEEKLSPTDAVSRMQYYDEQGIVYDNWTESYNIKKSLTNYYQNQFDLYYAKLVDRSYIGNKVEAEIECTTGTDYSNIEVVSPAVIGPSLDAQGNPALNSNGNPIVDKNGNPITDSEGKAIDVIITPAVVKIKNTSGVTVPYGALDTNGNLVNEGKTKYTDYTWNIFVTEIADAVTVAQRGHDPSYPAAGEYYNPANTYDAEVSSCYSAYKELRRAEITLIEDIPVGGYNVTASLVVATNSSGAHNNVAVNGDYTITLTDATDTVVATTTLSSAKGANTFTLEGVPNGTYTMTITSAYSMPRTATVVVDGANVTAAAPIAIVACDYEKNGVIDAMDAVTVYQQAASGGASYCDLDGNNAVDAMDAVIVYVIAANSINLPAVTIK